MALPRYKVIRGGLRIVKTEVNQNSLKLLYDEPKHGYQLAKELVENEHLKPENLNINSIYIVLNRMEEHNLTTSEIIESEEGRPRRIYTITDKGIKLLKIGLESILDNKKVYEELEKFYKREFRES